MRLCHKKLSFALVAPVLVLAGPLRAEAITRVNGNFSLEETYASGPAGSTKLLEGGINLDIMPQTKKNLRSRFSFPIRFSVADSLNTMRATPVGSFAVDVGGQWYNLNLQYSSTATVSSVAELTESTTSRAAFSLAPPDLPQMIASYSKTQATSAGITTESDTYSMFSDYRYKWFSARGGYAASQRAAGKSPPLQSSSLLFGFGGSYGLLPRTTVTADYDFNTSSSSLAKGKASVTTGNVYRVSADSRPLEYLGLGGNFSKTVNESDGGSSEQQFTELSATLNPSSKLRFIASSGNRKFSDLQRQREVAFTTMGLSYNDALQENVQLGANYSRSYEKDPSQGNNVRDNLGVNVVMAVYPRIFMRGSVNVSRNQNEDFISAKRFDASGTLSDRDALASDPAGKLAPGFIFFDDANGDLYTLTAPRDPLTSAPAVWSLPTHLVTEQYSVSKNVQVNMIPSDRSGLVFSYASSASSESLNVVKPGNQSFNGSFTYAANRRTSYSLAGTATFPESGNNAYSGTLTMSYRFFRRHQLNLSYAQQSNAGKSSNTASGTLGLALRKKTSLEMVFSASQLLEKDQRFFVKVRFLKTF